MISQFFRALPMTIRFSILVLSSLLLSACLDRPQEETVAPKPVEVVAYTVEARDVPARFEFIGKTVSSRKVEIRSRVEGFLEKRLYTEGAMVEAGQPMFQMDTKPFEARLQAMKAELAQQQARLENAQANLKRVRPLAKKNAVAQKELDDALANYRSAAAAVEVAKANVIQAELNLGYTLISTPVSGVSSYAVQQEGSYIGLGNSLLTYVARLDPMWVEFSVSENQIFNMRKMRRQGLLNAPADDIYKVEVILADGSTYPHKGKLTFADASISEETGTFLLRAQVANPNKMLRPGQFVRAWIEGGIRPAAILVPQRAVQQRGEGSYVWVIREDGSVEQRPVTTGAWEGKEWFISKGLKDGERIVVDGAQKLRPDTRVEIVQPDTEKQPAAASGS
jgi:membrane fusion protein (multidrug efflux system)